MWAWHTRTWVHNGAIDNQQVIGIGWYLLLFGALTVVYVISAMLERS